MVKLCTWTIYDFLVQTPNSCALSCDANRENTKQINNERKGVDVGPLSRAAREKGCKHERLSMGTGEG